jgi:hypothetical protein
MIDYRAATDVTDPNVVRFVEQYEDAAAFEVHTQTEQFQAFEAALPDRRAPRSPRLHLAAKRPHPTANPPPRRGSGGVPYTPYIVIF